jgi:cell division septal protein FtsQ
MRVKAPAEKNFRRSRTVKPVKKRAARSRVLRTLLYCVGIILALMVTAYAVNAVVHASVLQIRTIDVRGYVRLSRGEVQALVDGLRGSSILTVDLSAYRARLLESPWVADVALRRVLPSTIEVFVSEREPVALCRINGQLYLIDRSGALIDAFGPKYRKFDLPIVDGATRVPSSGEPVIDEARVALAARVIDDVATNAALASRVSQIDVADLFDAVVMLDDDPAMLHLGTEKFAERLQGYIDLAERLRETVPDIDYASLQFDGRIYVKAAGSSGMRPAVRRPGTN